MTAPNQPYPSWMQLLGLGAFQVGGTGGATGTEPDYGQGITSSAVTSVIQGPATALTNLDGITAISGISNMLSSYLSTIPLQGLQMFQGFLPGTTDAEFVDVPTAVTTILNSLGIGNIAALSADAARITHDLTVLFDVFHLTYPAGTPSDPPGQTTWYAAWNDLLAYIEKVLGITPNPTAPTIGTAITNSTDWITRGLQDLEILFDVFHLTYNAGTSTDPPGTLGVGGVGAGKPTWYSAWNDVLALIGLTTGTTPTTPAPTIGSAITTATTAGNNGSSWSTRLTNDLLILLDVFHLTYTSTQWNTAWADLLSLFGIVNSTSTPTNPTPTIGPAITSAQSSATTANTNAGTAQSTANTAQTTANTGNTNTGTFLGYTRILSDVFHLTYNAGSPSDTPTTLGVGGVGNGKPTWYSAWNGLLVLEGLVKATSAPTDTAPTTGAVIAANTAAATTAGTNASIAISNASAASTAATAASAANQATNDAIVTATTGTPVTGSSTTDVTTGLSNIPATNVVGNTGAAVTFGAVGGGNFVTGASPLANTWSHTIASTDLGVLVAISYLASSGQVWSSAVTYGGVAMSKIQSVTSAAIGGDTLILEVWWLKAPATGTKTVSATITRTAGSGSSQLQGNSVSYLASKIGTTVGNTGGSNANPSMSATSDTGRMVVGVFGVLAFTAPTMSAYTQTQRSSLGPSSGMSLVIGDAAGSSSVSFGVHCAVTSNEWVGITVEVEN